MAITKDYLNTSDLGTLAAWMQANLVPDYFAAVTFGNNTLTCADGEGNTLLTISAISGVVTAYKSASITVTLTSAIPAPFTYACTCANGAIIESVSGQNHGCMLITKTNNGATAIVFSAGTSGTVCRSGIKSVAWGDGQAENTRAFYTSTEEQTQIVPFLTDAAFGAVSYTPNAFYIPVGQYYNAGIGVLTISGVNYLTNGYWAIKDA